MLQPSLLPWCLWGSCVLAAWTHLCPCPLPPCPPPPVRGRAAPGPTEACRVYLLHRGGPGRAVCPAHPYSALVRALLISCPLGLPLTSSSHPDFEAATGLPGLTRPKLPSPCVVRQCQATVLCCPRCPLGSGCENVILRLSLPPHLCPLTCHIFLNPG